MGKKISVENENLLVGRTYQMNVIYWLERYRSCSVGSFLPRVTLIGIAKHEWIVFIHAHIGADTDTNTRTRVSGIDSFLTIVCIWKLNWVCMLYSSAISQIEKSLSNAIMQSTLCFNLYLVQRKTLEWLTSVRESLRFQRYNQTS